jgi:hypothetical protein
MRSKSLTVTVNEQLAVKPPESVATQLTFVTPIAKLDPLAGEQITLETGQLSSTDRAAKFTNAVHFPGSLVTRMFGGQLILGAGLFAIVVAVATLLPGLVSGVVELKMVAVFPIIAPLATEQLTFAMIVITAVVPGGSDANVTVRILPDPPQTPPPVELHEAIVVLPENTSLTVTEVAVAGPALLTTMVFVIWEPVSTGLGETLVSTERSAGVPPVSPPT